MTNATISTPEYLLGQARRRFTPSLNNFPGMYAADRKLWTTEFKQRALSGPPAGSDLKPVLGDAGLPVLGHLIEMFMNTPDYLLHVAPANRQGIAVGCGAALVRPRDDGGPDGERADLFGASARRKSAIRGKIFMSWVCLSVVQERPTSIHYFDR